jgi:putative colanic acid biosysnthesis UDP-glucose lipid carrier transferase
VNGYQGETPITDLMLKRVELDRWYISNRSMWLDIAILFRTMIIGLQPTAYLVPLSGSHIERQRLDWTP